ncbi:phosphatase PAP2 family protein [Paractinoplanes rishiriensis]|uniref:Phosphatase PAP2 family protein n=1 Tax=Paractinoplanes rishiriensis TaxID=1050105 RepID=A0A919JWB4_9ACTN|nr:phosphatase PAP2 family protein [Actinoplanes rishiriensis]GIE94765.1 phosphatase PAP2 family protein [Actinoplanes rishiriensis]
MPADHDESLGVRLAVAAGGAVALLVPFALIAVLVVGNVGWLHRLDMSVTDALHNHALGNPGWVRFMAVWSTVFDPWVWRVAALGLVVWLVRRNARSLAWWVGITMVAGGLLGVLLKVLVGRHRPSFLDPVANAVGYAFPSGHALNNALGAAVFLLVLLPLVRHRPGLRALLWVAAVVVPVVTAISRVALGVHWTSDVTAGLLLGVAVVAATTATYLHRAGRVRAGIEEQRIG